MTQLRCDNESNPPELCLGCPDCAKPCEECGGKRYIPGKAAGNTLICPACNGTGKQGEGEERG